MSKVSEKQGGKFVWDVLKIGGGLVVGWLAYSRFAIDHNMPINPAIDAERFELAGKNSTFLSYYADKTGTGRPLVLLHSINAAGNAYEMKPLFEHYRLHRPVYALDLPGFGFSERSNRVYTPELYVNAISDFMEHIGEACDVITLSLSSEFAAMVASERPQYFNSMAMISPTGFRARDKNVGTQHLDQSVSNRTYRFLSNPIWSQAIFDLIASEVSIQYFLQKSFSGNVDRKLAEYSWLTAHQPGARYAPLYFVSGKLFTRDIYESTYETLKTPTMVIFDEDPYVSFERLPELLETNSAWRARRISTTRGLPHFERLSAVTDILDNYWQDLD